MNPPTFELSYRDLPPNFYSSLVPTPVTKPGRVRVNPKLAEYLNVDLEWLNSDEALSVFAGNSTVDGTKPIATKYGGHQFGGWNPELGDGRALLLGEVIAVDGQRYDIQLKGSGPTPYSRGGDGRAPLGPVIREYIVSEAMFALGVPTTRSLAAVTTGELVMRNLALPGGVLTRVAKSHIRIGTFEYFSAHADSKSLNALLQYTIDRHYPETQTLDVPALGFLQAVVKAQAELIAKWQSLGFIHGVMNTDNMLLSGETIDYGPCAFLDRYRKAGLFSSIDRQGRYAYQNQPGIAQWNLAQLARALIEPMAEQVKDRSEERTMELALQAVEEFTPLYEAAYLNAMGQKLGLDEIQDEDLLLVKDLLELMENTNADFTLTFRVLTELVGEIEGDSINTVYELPNGFEPWIERWRTRIETTDETARKMSRVNPAYIPRNHHIESAIELAQKNDFSLFNAMTETLEKPFVFDANNAEFAKPPLDKEVVTATFCGT